MCHYLGLKTSANVHGSWVFETWAKREKAHYNYECVWKWSKGSSTISPTTSHVELTHRGSNGVGEGSCEWTHL